MNKEIFKARSCWKFSLIAFALGAGLVYGIAALLTKSVNPFNWKNQSIPTNAPIVVRGGSVTAVCITQNCAWSGTAASPIRSSNLSQPVSKIYLDDVQATPGGQTISTSFNVPRHWDITITFRDPDGIHPSPGTEKLHICTDLSGVTCTSGGISTQNIIYLQGNPGFTTAAGTNTGVSYNMTSPCLQNHVPATTCNHIYSLTFSWNAATGVSLPNGGTYFCGDTFCKIGLVP
jgi:hypothetical protein